MLHEEIEFTHPSKEEIYNAQQTITNTAKRLQVLGKIRLPSRKPTLRKYEQTLGEVARNQIEHSRHSGQWTPRSYTNLLPYLATILRDEGVEAAREAFPDIRDPVFELSRQLLSENTDREELIHKLEEKAEQELRRAERQFKKLVAGVAAIQEGKDAREIGEICRD